MAKSVASMSPAEQLKMIRKKLQHFSTDREPTKFLKTPYDELNSVFGSSDFGIPYGKIIELSGPESCGKTATAFDLVARVQRSGGIGMWMDAENSFHKKWAKIRRVDTDKLYLVEPYIGSFGKQNPKKKRMATAQELCAELEGCIKLSHSLHPDVPRFAVVDSVTALLTKDEHEAGIDKQNMKSKLSLASFMNQLLRRWVGLCQATDTTILFINQLRINPMQMFGNPEYTTGGKALKFYCHVRVKARRANKGGKIMKMGKQCGIRGVMENIKNKVGGEEFSKCGYKIYWTGKTSYLDAALVGKE